MHAMMKKILLITFATVQTLSWQTAEARDFNIANFDEDRLSDLSAAVLRESRELVTIARRAQYREIQSRAQAFYGQTSLFYRGLEDGLSIRELGDILDDLELINLNQVRRAVDRANDRSMDDQYRVLRRTFFALKAEFEDGAEEPDYTRLVINYGTYFKATTAQASSLPYWQKCYISRNQVVVLEGDVRLTGGTVRVTLVDPIPGCSFGSVGQTGYIYTPHFNRY
ncbi:MAG: hypothetical protein HRU19_26310 [Pseudobacteriovorax sp.]|nr:hypothetical protein [Pseudobacteriovorax sp.]